MRVLVTGAGGFVGSHLLPRLRDRGHEVVAIDREVEMTDPEAVLRAVTRSAPEALVHLAGISSVAASLDDPLTTWKTNYVGARHLLEAVRHGAPACHAVLVGSGEVYGLARPGEPPFDESHPLAPRSPYAAAKAAADRLAGAYAEIGVAVARLRPFNHTGPGQRAAFAAGSFATQLARIRKGQQTPVVRVGNLESTRDFLDVEDVVDAYVAVVERRALGVYNVASGRGRTIRELLDGLVAASGTRVDVEVDPARVRPTDASTGNAQRLRRATGWQPRVAFEDTLQRMFAHALEQLEAS